VIDTGARWKEDAKTNQTMGWRLSGLTPFPATRTSSINLLELFAIKYLAQAQKATLTTPSGAGSMRFLT